MNSIFLQATSKDILKLDSFFSMIDTGLIAAFVFTGMMICIYLGRQVGAARVRDGKEDGNNTTILTSVYGLLAFILAFTFGMSGNRFESRRKIIVDEANAIGTAILRCDLYPEEHRAAFRKDFKDYVEYRIRYYEEKRKLDNVFSYLDSSQAIGQRIWNRVITLSHDPGIATIPTMQMTPAVNAMLDLASERTIGELLRVPDSILIMLFILSFISAFFMGYHSSGGKLNWLFAAAFCLLTSCVMYITLDLDRPRRGLIQLNVSNQAMVQLRKMF